MRTILALLFISIASFSFHKDIDTIIAWLRDHCHSISPLNTNENDEDLSFLSELQKGNRILAIGEESHGIGDFAKIKHRVFKYLALHHDYKLFAIEQDFCKVEPLNQYVLSGEGDARSMLSTFSRSYANRETLKMIEWMRSYNSEVQSDEQKLKIFGFDCQRSVAILNRLKEIFVDDPYISTLLDSVPLIEKRKLYGKTMSESDLGKIQHAISSSQKSHQDSAYIHQLLTMLQYSQELSEGRSINRDYYMAQITSWILNSEGPDSKMIVSAHNGHLMYGKVHKKDSLIGRQGFFLREEFKDQLYTIGIDFNRGSFWAAQILPGDSIITKKYTLPDAPEHSLSNTFSRTGYDIFFLDFAEFNSNDAILEWFSKSRSMRYVSALFTDDMGNEDAMISKKIPERFDGLMFFDEVKAAELLNKKRN